MNSIEKADGREQGILCEAIAIGIAMVYRREESRSTEIAAESTFM